MDLTTFDIHYDVNGLIPAIVQDARTNQVLMMAYMNAETLQLTLQSGETHFWSRSRREIWHKGATSGNIQKVIEIALDCDQDTLLVRVQPAGPACHTGAVSCFFTNIPLANKRKGSMMTFESLYEIICQRRDHPVAGSYTNSLLTEGEDKILKKVGEEAMEVILAAKGQGDQRVIEETSDLVYHLFVLLASRGLTLEDILGELQKRHQPK